MAWAARMTAALDKRALDKPPLWPAILCGGLSGFLAGITGIGGGLFVAASMLLLRWAPTKRVAAAAQTSNLYTAAAAFAAIWLTHPALPPRLAAMGGGGGPGRFAWRLAGQPLSAGKGAALYAGRDPAGFGVRLA